MCEHEASTTIQEVLALRGHLEKCDLELTQHLKSLRNMCARGAHLQDLLATQVELQDFLNALLFCEGTTNNTQLQTICWQLLANIMVQNLNSQRLIWQRHGQAILQVTPTLNANTDVQLMILHNVFQSDSGLLTELQILRAATQVWQAILTQQCNKEYDFLHFLFEHFLVKGGRTTVRCYAQLESTERIAFLDYLASYLRHDSPNGTVHSFLLQHISKEFKIKSDCVLRQTGTQDLKEQQLRPREALGLLRVIACSSGSETYASVFATDHSLFLNVSSLLRCLVAAGKQSVPNMFTPLQKLEEVALTSNVSREFEAEVSFELKTLLVRSVANLLYKNKTNQDYCLDTELMPTLLECTNMDARNPLIKEWSILAIRNACIGSPEIQEIIAGLTKQGTAPNDILNELNLEMGSLRIKPNNDI